MKSTVPMKTAKAGYIVMSLLLIVFGILTFIDPKGFENTIGTITGISLILFGLVKMIGYFSKDLFRLCFQYDLAFGILLITLGVLVLIKPENVLNFLVVVLGILIFADGLFKIQIALDAKAFGIHKWWMILSIAVLTGVIGFMLLIRPGEGSAILIKLLSIAFVSDGIMSLVTVLSSVKIIDHQRHEEKMIEGRWREI